MKRELRQVKTKHGAKHTFVACDIENNPDTGEFICAALFGNIKKRVNTRTGKKVVTTYEQFPIDEYFDDIALFHSYVLSLEKGSCLLVFYNLPYDKIYFDGIIDAPTLS